MPKSITSEEALALAWQLFDPRGRCDRRGFLFLAVGLMVLQISLAGFVQLFDQPVNGTMFLILNAPLFWVGMMAVLKRLHDSNRSGWWVPLAFAGWLFGAVVASLITTLVLGAEALQHSAAQGGPVFWFLIAFMWLPAFGGLLWLHASAGDRAVNRFGAVPGPLGFAPGPRASRAQPAADAMPSGVLSAH